VAADRGTPAQELDACGTRDLVCFQAAYESECSRPEATTETCLVFVQRLETARRSSSYSTGMALLLGETLHTVSRRDLPPEVKERYRQRSRAAYGEVVSREPLKASGYLGLAELAETGEQRVEWLRGAVRAEYQPAHMELLANALSIEIGGHAGYVEAARVIEDAYTHEASTTERWRYGASAWERYREALTRYPTALTERSLENVALRVKQDIDYAALQRALLRPESDLPHLAYAVAIMCEESIAAIVGIDECMAGLESAVASAEGAVPSGSRRLLAEAVLTGMRTIAGESPPKLAEARRNFPDWIERLLATPLEPVDVAADLLEAKADYTVDLAERSDALLAAIGLVRNRGDLRLKLGATYVDRKLWPEALEELRVAKLLLPPEEHERVDELFEAADEAYQARFVPPEFRE
jgi:hypothetical protein